MASHSFYGTVEPGGSGALTDFQTSKQRMDLFNNKRLGANPTSASPFSPPTAMTDGSWDDSTPPPYDVAVRHGDWKGPQQAVLVNEGPATRTQTPNSPKSSRGSVKRQNMGSVKVRASSRRRSSKPTPRSYSRPFRPGITVDTSVTRHRGAAPEQVFPGLNDKANALGSTPATPEDAAETPRGWVRKVSQLKRSRGSRSIKHDAAEQPLPEQLLPGRAVSTNSRPLRVVANTGYSDDVTPSDRAIPIALFSMPDAPLPSQTLHAPQGLQTAGHTSPSALSSTATPMIQITPAQDELGWTLPSSAPTAYNASRPRPPSSVYSQSTWRSTIAPQASGQRPPVPPLPSALASARAVQYSTSLMHDVASDPASAHKRDSSATAFEEDDVQYRKQTMSAETDFEEDQTPNSADSIKKRFAQRPKDLAIDTNVPTPRRSKGWWNVITTPFEFSRPGTKVIRSPTEITQQHPDIPDLAAAVQRYEQSKELDLPTSSPTIPPPAALPPLMMGHPRFSSDTMTAAQQVPLNHGLADGTEQRMFIHLSETSPSKSGTLHNPYVSQHVSTSTAGRGLGVGVLDKLGHLRADSQQSIFSPNDRDVPLVLDETLTTNPPMASKPALALNTDRVVPNPNFGPSDSPARHQSPASTRGETPVVEIASFGTVHSAKTVDHSPNPSMSQKSIRTNIPAPLGSLPLRDAEPRPMYHTEYRQQQTPTMAFSPPPMTSFPGPPSFSEKQTSGATPPPALANVRSVWEQDDPPQEKLKKRSKYRKSKKRKKNRCCWLCCICFSILVLVALIVALAVTLTRGHGNSSPTPTQTAWLNLTGFPPMPTGEMTVAQPTLLAQVNGCTDPTTLWSCDLPKEDQQANLPAGPSEPNFRLTIAFSNDTISNKSLTQPLRFKRDLGGLPFTPDPTPPSKQDQIFLGNTTDHNDEPFQGEDTPFFISFLLSTGSVSKAKAKRSAPSQTSSGSAATSTANFATAIPSPSIENDGTSSPANLLPSPLPSNQPLMLYNRGTPQEHYGFYTYFDRSIFLRSVTVTNTSEVNPGQIPADQDGGSTEDGAVARCTWTETRFLVQIWTRTNAPLLSASTNSSSNASSNAANDFAQPGSFPYPITITTDRHGGTRTGKMIYCYALDDETRPVPLNKTLYFEDRGFQGTLVNPQEGPFGSVTIDPNEPASEGGIDGGSGGCGCRWGNWDDSRGF